MDLWLPLILYSFPIQPRESSFTDFAHGCVLLGHGTGYYCWNVFSSFHRSKWKNWVHVSVFVSCQPFYTTTLKIVNAFYETLLIHTSTPMRFEKFPHFDGIFPKCLRLRLSKRCVYSSPLLNTFSKDFAFVGFFGDCCVDGMQKRAQIIPVNGKRIGGDGSF